MIPRRKDAVLLLAHGSPNSVDEVPAFLTRVTSGRPLSQEVIEEVKHRYAAIGKSPLTGLTLKQAELLAERLGIPVYVGMRNWHPLISHAVQQMLADGVSHATVICLAPHNSRTSVGLYRKALSADSSPDLSIDFVESWHDQPFLIQAFAEKLQVESEAANREEGKPVPVIFTAHSVPERTVREGDPYENQARQTAALVAAAVGLGPQQWRFAFQSQGMSGGPWLGPTVEDTILELKGMQNSAFLIQPIGFLCDHVEVLYDIDIAFKRFAEEAGMRLRRAESLNDSPLLTAALEQIVRSRIMTASSAADRT
jgi:ferrochelatase